MRRAPRSARPWAWPLAVVLASTLSACGVVGNGSDEDSEQTSASTPAATPSASASPTEAAVEPIESEFSESGSYQSHVSAPGLKDMDFVFTLYPTRATPRTGEWYAGGRKYFSFTFQVYDLSRGLRDPFDSKRHVYLESMTITSEATNADGAVVQGPYELDGPAKDLTFDPEPLATRNGMIVSSPKGSFELRNQVIDELEPDTTGVTLSFTAIVNVQTAPGGATYQQRTITERVPISIFASDEPTEAESIPVDAN